MSEEDFSKIYDAYYYATGCGRPYQRDEGWLSFFGGIADHIVRTIQPRTVLDAGCAWGFLVENLRQRGVEAYGVDISEYAIQNVHPDIRPYCWLGSIAEPLPQRYDLIVCIEVLEHMPMVDAEKAIENLCRSSESVIFSSTPFDYREATHFNVQPPEVWAELFARQGFFRDIDYDASYLTPWAVRFRPKSEPLPRMVREYERRFFLLWKENVDLRSLNIELRDQNASLIEQIAALNQHRIALSEQAVELDRKATIATIQLQELRNSRSWRLIQKFQQLRLRLIPPGSRLERILFRR